VFDVESVGSSPAPEPDPEATRTMRREDIEAAGDPEDAA
jgi:hypothetical protein